MQQYDLCPLTVHNHRGVASKIRRSIRSRRTVYPALHRLETEGLLTSNWARQEVLIHGDDDPAVPVAQAEEMFVGLMALGKDVTLVKYQGEGHVPTGYSLPNRRDVTERVLAFFKEKFRQLSSEELIQSPTIAAIDPSRPWL